jgi:SWI/SNF-related matrix-associated actin-dependent regulator of chromatin subfamily A-like protein 1
MSDLLPLFPYQREGAEYLASKDQALLADEMGLGKSAQAIAGCDAIGAQNILVICPANLRVNWCREFDRFSPLDRPIAAIMSAKDHIPSTGVVVCSYDLLCSDKVREALKKIDWDVLVLDEAHFLKERSARRTKAVYGFGKRSPGLAVHAKRIWRLTGTPAPNDASELYTHLKSAGIVDDQYWDFVFKFCTGFDSDYGFRITGHKNTEELKKLLAQFMLRRKKTEVLKDLPPIYFQEVTVEKSAVELDPIFYEQIRGIGENKFLSDMAQQDNMLRMALEAAHKNSTNNQPAANAANVLESMAPSLVTLRRYLGMQKLPAVCDILAQELESEMLDKVVIFAVHQSVIEGAREKLRKFGAVTLYGNTPPLKRQENVDRFMTDSKCRVFIGNIQAAGVGITLTSAYNVAFIEADWVPANNAQAAMRCHRIGQTMPVRVRFFTCADTVDEQIQKTLLRKTRELAKIF